MESFLASTVVVAIAEIGDKTQLLSLLLAVRYRRALPIIGGIFVATLANHALAGLLGEWIRAMLAPHTLRWAVGGSLLAVAVWTLKPDKVDGEISHATPYGVFALTCAVFFLAEIGDKTQIATVILAAKYNALVSVVLGTTLGMMLANVPVVYAGSTAARRIPLMFIRMAAAGVFAALGIAALLGVGI